MIMYKSKMFMLCIALLFMCGCVNLKAVNDYAKSSKETIQSFTEAKISLTESNSHLNFNECLFDDNGIRFNPDCYYSDNLIYQKADSLVAVVNTVLEKYFLSIEELSSNQSSTFGLESENLKSILSDSTTFKNISSDQIDAAEGLVNKMTNAAFSLYKRKQLSKIIKEVHDDLILVIKMNQSNHEDIKRNLLNNLQANQNLYQNIFGDPTINKFDKIIATQLYLEESNEWMAKILIQEKFIAALEQMIIGHGQLLAKGKKISTKHVIREIAVNTTEIIEIRNEIIKLKSNE